MAADPCPSALIIVGASVRAAAESAVRAGWTVYAFDLFADRDLQAIAHCTRIPSHGFPTAVPRLLQLLPPDIPWMYTGGIENHAALIREITGERRLLGVPGDLARRTRDPHVRRAIAELAGWHAPRRLSAEQRFEPCIFRPAVHCGGFGIRFAHAMRSGPGGQDIPGWREEFVAGESFAGAFLADGRSARLCGVTRQSLARDLVDHPLHEIRPFAYTGSLGPLPLDDQTQACWERLGRAIMSVLPMQGVFGVDAICREAEPRWTLIEINPRYTASMELWERATGASVLRVHLGVWGQSLTLAAAETRGRDGSPNSPSDVCHAKRIVFAPFDVRVTSAVAEMMDSRRRVAGYEYPELSDLPRAGVTIRRQQPIATVFGRGTDSRSAQSQLESNVRQLTQHLSGLST